MHKTQPRSRTSPLHCGVRPFTPVAFHPSLVSLSTEAQLRQKLHLLTVKRGRIHRYHHADKRVTAPGFFPWWPVFSAPRYISAAVLSTFSAFQQGAENRQVVENSATRKVGEAPRPPPPIFSETDLRNFFSPYASRRKIGGRIFETTRTQKNRRQGIQGRPMTTFFPTGF